MKLAKDTRICNIGACGNYCQFVEELSNVKDIKKQITIRNRNTMMATKLGDLKCEITQVNGSKLEVT
jgi:hypothetical protein